MKNEEIKFKIKFSTYIKIIELWEMGPMKMKNKWYKNYLYLVPSMLIIMVFQIIPLFKVFAMGFYTKFNYVTDEVYEVGIDNFINVLKDENFYIAIKNTFTYVILSVPLSIILALIVAVNINKIKRLKGFFTSVYFIPFVTASVAISVVWRWIFHSEYGVLNVIINFLGYESQGFLLDEKWTMPMLVFLNIWKGLGYKTLIILAGLQNIDERYYNAARIDGAGKFMIFRKITIPMLTPTLIFLVITSTISSIKIFDEIFVLYDKQPGPLKSALTIVYYVFDKFYMKWQFASASAAAFILFVIIAIFSIIQFRIGRRFDYYE